ncbi:MAG: aminotransferase class V-fold PLP-dependent enzyme, partial [Myxococcales bacterium]|nr:aminotransferase class V-fold PLP-dependent enzyme [Myxococcales bacterium]
RGVNGIKPGWVRLSLPWYASAADVDFILDAALFVADHGDAFVPAYRLDWGDGVWHPIHAPEPRAMAVSLDIDALLGALDTPLLDEAPLGEAELADTRARYFAEARALAERLRAAHGPRAGAARPPTGDAEVDSLVWFDYCEATPLSPR